jgi:hypothetical protein
MKFSAALMTALALALAACAQPAAFRKTRHVECQMNGENAAACNRGFANEFLDMKQEQPENL